MVIIHVFEFWIVYDCSESANFVHILEFLGGPLAAPVFMFSLGLGIMYSRHNSPKELLHRGIRLFILGYVLNIFRYSISYFFIGHTYGYFNIDVFLNNLLSVDIFQFAGMAFIVTALLKKINAPLWCIGALSVVLLAIGSCIGYESETLFGRSVIGIFVCNGSIGIFPFFVWYIYPVAGMIFAHYIKQTHDLVRWHRVSLGISALFLLGIITGCLSCQIDLLSFFTLENGEYYQQNFISVLFTLSTLILAESIVYFVSQKFSLTKVKQALTYLSANISTIYIIQWLIIGNSFNWISEGLPLWSSVPLGLIITFISAFLAKYLSRFLKV